MAYILAVYSPTLEVPTARWSAPTPPLPYSAAHISPGGSSGKLEQSKSSRGKRKGGLSLIGKEQKRDAHAFKAIDIVAPAHTHKERWYDRNVKVVKDNSSFA
ncbi:hypothetical protein SELMODRAFT_426189 [Selaginella moellendorffii]|uniref:Uncharacterized protein n=1 Tax=Selaginella moellendorffii TaxID=88036 RepID=D8SVM3_SELML|nr:hypothetical protein SELMODRAFT_426189 [Selaginella moellendorffii]